MRARRQCSGVVGSSRSSVAVINSPPSGVCSERMSAGGNARFELVVVFGDRLNVGGIETERLQNRERMRARLDEGVGDKEPSRLLGGIGRQRQPRVRQMGDGGNVVA